jgi:hypothetical protein
MKWFIFVLVFSTLMGAAYAHTPLSPQQIERVKAFKKSLHDVDSKPVGATMAELEKAPHPEVNIEIKEAMAKAFNDIVREQNVEGLKKKQWLYSMIALNMACLQFGGGSASPNPLNGLILYKLKKYLPPSIFTASGFRYSLD